MPATRQVFGQNPKQEEKTYLKPQNWKYYNPDSLKVTQQTVRDYLNKKRQITQEVIDNKIVGSDTQYNYDLKDKDAAVVFNYYLDDVLVNQKYRFLSSKAFTQTPGCRQIPYNMDSLRPSPDNEEEAKLPVYIVEGEMDVLSLMTAGFKRVISIPNGAGNNLDWVSEFWDKYLSKVQEFFIAVDTDSPGIDLAERLAARLGPAICHRVYFGGDCKDSNDYLVKYGSEALKTIVDNAPYYPMDDVYGSEDIRAEVIELFERGAFPGYRVGWASHFDETTKLKTPKGLDDLVRWDTKRLVLVTGRSGDGKSEFVDELVVRLSLETGWKAAYFTPEKYPNKYHQQALSEKLTGKSFNSQERRLDRTYMSITELKTALDWTAKNIFYVGVSFDNMFIDRILNAADVHVKRQGIKILVIDPYNYIEKEMDWEWQLNQWDSKTVSKIRNFALERDLIVFLVIHPRKVYENNKEGERRRIEMTDISGTADFGNKADVCIVVDRHRENDMTTIYVDKVRNKDNGGRGICYMLFDPANGRFAPCTQVKSADKTSPEYTQMENMTIRDMTNWLEKKPTIWAPDKDGKVIARQDNTKPEDNIDENVSTDYYDTLDEYESIT